MASLANKKNSEGYVIRPNYQKKFRGGLVAGVLGEAMAELLSDYEYDAATAGPMCESVAAAVKAKLKELDLERYKYIVQVFMGEQRGEGAKIMSRCFWDSDTDAQVKEVYSNNSLFCVAAAFGVFHY